MKSTRSSSPVRRGSYLIGRMRRVAQCILLSLCVYYVADRIFFGLGPYVFKKMSEQLSLGSGQGDGPSTAARKLILGVYLPVDPSIYDQVNPQNVKPQIKEVADLMTDLYKLFIKMGYMEASDFAWPPHDNPRIDTEELALYGFTKDVVDLMQLLPYRTEAGVEKWNFGTDAGEFIRWGDFMPDPRRTMHEPERTGLREVYDYAQDLLDPFYAIDFAVPGIPEDRRDVDADERSWDHEDGPYMRPTYLAMSGCGNHGSIMIFNTENYHMWLIGQLDNTNDPYFESHEYKETKTINRNDLGQHPSRLGSEFLRDIISHFETLRWLPGGLYGPENEEYAKYKGFYEKAGWPNNFSLTEFHKLRIQSDDDQAALERAWRPLHELDSQLWRSCQDTEQRQLYESAKIKASDRSLCKDDNEYEWAQQWLKHNIERYENPDAHWEKLQDRLREDLSQQEKELALVRAKSGRFEGITDDQVVEWGKGYEKRIEDLQHYLADKSEEARTERMLSEAQKEAALVSDEIRKIYEDKKAAMNEGQSLAAPRDFP